SARRVARAVLRRHHEGVRPHARAGRRPLVAREVGGCVVREGPAARAERERRGAGARPPRGARKGGTVTRPIVRFGLVFAAIGALGSVVSVALDPRRMLFAWLAAFGSALFAVLAALVLVMILHVVRARWWLVLRPALMGVVETLPAFVVLLLPIAIGRTELYPELEVEHQRTWASAPFFFARAAAYFAVWIALLTLVKRADEINERAPTSERPERFEAQRRVSGVGLPLMAFTIHFASVDWLMALVPGWTSTAYGLYVFVG